MFGVATTKLISIARGHVMFKNLIFAAVTAAGVFVGVAATSAPAEAGPHRHFRHFRHFSHFRGHFYHGQRFAKRGNLVIVRNHPHWHGGVRHHYVQRNSFVIVNSYPGWHRHHYRYYGRGPVPSYASTAPTSCTWRYGYWHSIPAHLRICTTAYF